MSHIFSFYIFSSALVHIYATHNILQSHNLLLLSCTTNSTGSTMVPDFQKPRIIEIHVRMDCNGCVQKVKKALNGINGKKACDMISLSIHIYAATYLCT
ncbi:putative heavy metal-associated domain, HMA [Lupinus albus]|uniref:Putative heavy metal-associated domain, HMA n=1 Tax=Lupinus albus TaxID=3870 RepID=A0A6A4P3X3_LUPAL|nr:putative heavy metal-associated domain, HMA [Lupinus albus]